MNEVSRWRLAVAHQVAATYIRHPSVRAIMVSGSVARGYADTGLVLITVRRRD